jgi:hypothetical protein
VRDGMVLHGLPLRPYSPMLSLFVFGRSPLQRFQVSSSHFVPREP